MSSAGSESQSGGEQTTPSSLEQREPLLRTKLFVPTIRPNRVTRPRLFGQIQSGLDKALILITAPAGYGKTTLVSNWLHETDISSTWFSLDEDDNDPIRFLQYLIAALQKIVPSIQLDLLGVLQGRQPSPNIALLNILINEISERAAPFVLVLDDFHAIHAQAVLEMLTHLLEHLPPQMHIALLSRTDPPIPLSRLRARNELIDIRADQLRFTREETAIFLNEAMALKLSSDDIHALEARTEGWIAGLQLASIAIQSYISMQAAKDVHGFVSVFTGSHYYIMDYLVEEVLRHQSEMVRTFLLQSSILARMCGPLCDDVVEIDQTGSFNGQAMLEELEQMNLFIIPLDSERLWYRYHHLFADVLNRRLEQMYSHLLPDLHRRASRWYEQNGFIFDGIRHALLAGDQDRAAQLLDQHGCLLLMRGEVVNLLHWIEALEPRSKTLPWIAIQKVWALCLTGQLDRVEGPLHHAEQLVSSLKLTDDVRTMLGAVKGARAYRANMLGETRLAADFALQALDYLPVSSDLSCSLRSAATSILGDASWMDGNLAEAQRAYADAVLISQAAGNIYMAIIANSNLADILMEQGKLRQASRIYSETLQMAAIPDRNISPLTDRVYAGLSRISYEWNHLEDAGNYVKKCIELSQGWGSRETQAIGYGMLARLEYVQRDSEKAREAIHAAEQFISEYPLSPWRSNSIKSDLARLWIAQGDFDRASSLLQTSGIPTDGLPHEGELSSQLEPLYLILLRMHLARGEFDAALTVSEWLLQKLGQTNRVGRVIEILVLQALAFQGKRDLEQALATLKKAFSLAQPERYIRTFLDEGEPVRLLILDCRLKIKRQAKDHLGFVHPGRMEYLDSLLSAFPLDKTNVLQSKLTGEQTKIFNLQSAFVKPLTLRELEVLKLIEAGCSNQEIAAKLFISMPTVKRHISNIYTKLGTSSRTQAVSRGKELNLLE